MQLILIALIHWIVIYPMDSVIHPLNNWGQVNTAVCTIQLKSKLPSSCYANRIVQYANCDIHYRNHVAQYRNHTKTKKRVQVGVETFIQS